MKVPSNKVEAMTSRDKGRPVLTQVYLRVDQSQQGSDDKAYDAAHLEATDSYGLVRVPVTLDDDDDRASGFVPVDALKAARKNSGRVTLTDTTVIAAGVTYPRPDEGTFPNVLQLVPEWCDTIPASAGEGEIYIDIGLDAEILKRLADSLGGKGSRVRLTIQCKPGPLEHVRTTLRPIGVRSLDDPSATGLLMPVRVDR